MPSRSLLTSWLLLPAALAVTFDCERIVADDQKFNLKALGGPKDVHWIKPEPPGVLNTTWTLDICQQLKKPKEGDKAHSCPVGTQVCGVKRAYNDENDGGLVEVIPVAGEYLAGGHLSPHVARLKHSSSNKDSEREGLRVELQGGVLVKQKQKAIIEFICDAEMEGTEGFEEEEKSVDVATYSRMGKREDEKDGEGEGEGDGEDIEIPDLDEGKALQFISYKEEGDFGVLRLDWKTKYACEDAKTPPAQSKKGSWGFFTWFLIIVFLLIASYIIFGSWLNYNRYGARGWDLIPHGDTIRDIPYIVKDWTSGVAGNMGSNGNRGGYSAV